nr:PREDICTED: 60S ribosomal protein L36a-like [Rhinolophus sinicus]
MVNVPKTHQTFYRECGKHQPHKVTQHEKGQESLHVQEKWPYDRKQSGYGGLTKMIFHKKAQILETVQWVEPNGKSKRMLPTKRCKHFEWGGAKKRKSQVIQF